ncbi:1-phosphofructokinase [Granulicatella sp.]
MIYTITFNPAVDLVIQVPNCQLGTLNRSMSEEYVAGGKGINMSVLLKRLGIDNIATGFLGGFSGEYIKEFLESEGINPRFISVEGTTRINVKIKGEVETEINAAGPTVDAEKFQRLMNYFEEVLQEGDVVFLAGNAAPGLDETSYVEIAKLCHARGVKLVLDTTKDSLLACLPYQPFIIKPNQHELEELFGVNIQTQDEIVHYALQLQKIGARNVLVSCGCEGAFLVSETGQVFTSNIPKGTLVNSVGAGDSMLAGFMAKFIETNDYRISLKQGAASGSATAFSVGIATRELIEELMPQIKIKEISRN